MPSTFLLLPFRIAGIGLGEPTLVAQGATPIADGRPGRDFAEVLMRIARPVPGASPPIGTPVPDATAQRAASPARGDGQPGPAGGAQAGTDANTTEAEADAHEIEPPESKPASGGEDLASVTVALPMESADSAKARHHDDECSGDALLDGLAEKAGHDSAFAPSTADPEAMDQDERLRASDARVERTSATGWEPLANRMPRLPPAVPVDPNTATRGGKPSESVPAAAPPEPVIVVDPDRPSTASGVEPTAGRPAPELRAQWEPGPSARQTGTPLRDSPLHGIQSPDIRHPSGSDLSSFLHAMPDGDQADPPGRSEAPSPNRLSPPAAQSTDDRTAKGSAANPIDRAPFAYRHSAHWHEDVGFESIPPKDVSRLSTGGTPVPKGLPPPQGGVAYAALPRPLQARQFDSATGMAVPVADATSPAASTGSPEIRPPRSTTGTPIFLGWTGTPTPTPALPANGYGGRTADPQALDTRIGMAPQPSETASLRASGDGTEDLLPNVSGQNDRRQQQAHPAMETALPSPGTGRATLRQQDTSSVAVPTADALDRPTAASAPMRMDETGPRSIAPRPTGTPDVGPSAETTRSSGAVDDRPDLPAVGPYIDATARPSSNSAAHPPVPPADLSREAIRDMAAHLVRHTDQSVEVALNPEELGRVRLTLHASDSGLTVQISTERSETQELLRRNLEQFAADLRSLGYVNVGFAFSGRHGHGHHRAMTARPMPANETTDMTPPGAPDLPRPGQSSSGLDLRV